jgi:hypothetical protein
MEDEFFARLQKSVERIFFLIETLDHEIFNFLPNHSLGPMMSRHGNVFDITVFSFIIRRKKWVFPYNNLAFYFMKTDVLRLSRITF